MDMLHGIVVVVGSPVMSSVAAIDGRCARGMDALLLLVVGDWVYARHCCCFLAEVDVNSIDWSIGEIESLGIDWLLSLRVVGLRVVVTGSNPLDYVQTWIMCTTRAGEEQERAGQDRDGEGRA